MNISERGKRYVKMGHLKLIKAMCWIYRYTFEEVTGIGIIMHFFIACLKRKARGKFLISIVAFGQS